MEKKVVIENQIIQNNMNKYIITIFIAVMILAFYLIYDDKVSKLELDNKDLKKEIELIYIKRDSLAKERSILEVKYDTLKNFVIKEELKIEKLNKDLLKSKSDINKTKKELLIQKKKNDTINNKINIIIEHPVNRTNDELINSLREKLK